MKLHSYYTSIQHHAIQAFQGLESIETKLAAVDGQSSTPVASCPFMTLIINHKLDCRKAGSVGCYRLFPLVFLVGDPKFHLIDVVLHALVDD